MEDWQKKYIQQSFSGLLDNTQCHIGLLAKLEAETLLSNTEQRTLDSIKDETSRTRKLYNILMTKVGAYEKLMEVLDEEKQSGAFHILLKGISERESQKSIGHNAPKLYQVVLAATSMQEYVKNAVNNLVTYYRQNLENVIFEDPNELIWNERHSQLQIHTHKSLQTTLGKFSGLNMEDITRDLDTQVNSILSETKKTFKTFQIYKKSSVQDYKDEMKGDIKLCKTVDELGAYYEENVEKIIKQFQESFPAQGDDITEKYLEHLKNALKNEFESQKSNFMHSNKIDEELDQLTIANTIEHYDTEMIKYMQKALALSDDELSISHRSASGYAISRCAGNRNQQHQICLQDALDKRLRLYRKRNEMTRSQINPAIGIDLGTVNCVIGVYRNGNVEIVLNQKGTKSTPSYVAYDELGNMKAVGHAAKLNSCDNPENTIYDAKRVIGRTVFDKDFEQDKKCWPFTLVDDSNEERCYKYKVHDKLLLPEDISTELLVECRRQAEAFLKCPVSKAVITVPAYFTDDQKRATINAGKQANLEVLTIINEPTAAGIAYGWQKLCEKPETVLIFDLGGGTFDVAIVNISSENIDVVAFDGDTHLGGNDVDVELMKHCADQFQASTNINLFGMAEYSKTKEEKLIAKRNLQRLHEACEACKRDLSFLPMQTINVESIADGKNLRIDVTKKILDDKCSHLYKRMLDIVERLLKTSKVDKYSINEIILVGGATRIPMIQNLLRSYFDQKSLYISLNPDEAVAYGAAVKAAILNGENFKGMLVKHIQDVIPMSIGIECILNGIPGQFYVIIKQNSKYPTEGKDVFSTYSDNQTCGQIRVYQGDAEKASENHFIGSYVYEGIPKGKKGTQSIQVIMKIDEMGMLVVEAICESTKKTECYKVGAIPFVGSQSRVNLEVTKSKSRGPQIPDKAGE